jgi:hypothetical protein
MPCLCISCIGDVHMLKGCMNCKVAPLRISWHINDFAKSVWVAKVFLFCWMDTPWLVPQWARRICSGCGGGAIHYPPYGPLYALGLDACLYRDKLKWHKAYPHEFVVAWMGILFTIFNLLWHLIRGQCHDWVFSELLKMQQKLRMHILV